MDVFSTSSASAPQSCSSSSGSEDEDKASGDTDDMDYFDPVVSQVATSQYNLSYYSFSAIWEN